MVKHSWNSFRIKIDALSYKQKQDYLQDLKSRLSLLQTKASKQPLSEGDGNIHFIKKQIRYIKHNLKGGKR